MIIIVVIIAKQHILMRLVWVNWATILHSLKTIKIGMGLFFRLLDNVLDKLIFKNWIWLD